MVSNGMQQRDEYFNTPRISGDIGATLGSSWPENVNYPQSEATTNMPQVSGIHYEPGLRQHQETLQPLYRHQRVEETGSRVGTQIAIPHFSPAMPVAQTQQFTQNMMGHVNPDSTGVRNLGYDFCDCCARQPHNANEHANAHESTNTTDGGVMQQSGMDEYLLGDVSMGSGNRATSGSSWAGHGDNELELHVHHEMPQSPYGYRQVEETGPQANTQPAVPYFSPVMPTAQAPVFTQNMMGHNTAYPGTSAHHGQVFGSAPDIPNSIGVPIASGSGNSRYDFRDSSAHQPHNANEQTNAHESSNTTDRGVTVELRRLREENRRIHEENRHMRRFIRSLLESD